MEFLERCKASGFATPDLDNRPRLKFWESEIWRAFVSLNANRRTGFVGSEPLEIASVRAWLQAHGWTGDAETAALDLILELDASWLDKGRSDGPSS